MTDAEKSRKTEKTGIFGEKTLFFLRFDGDNTRGGLILL